MDGCGEKRDESNFVGHKLNGTNYRLWKFQINTFMKARALTDNIEGKVPDSSASSEIKAKYERNEGKAMNAIIQSLDVDRANLVLTCTTAKEMIDKLGSIYEKNSEIRVMTLYEEYFSLKMKDEESIANYVAKVNQLASEIEQQGEKLSDRLKMVRVISSLPARFNNYKTVWYNTKETRTLDTLLSSLQLEEENLNRLDVEASSTSDAAFVAKAMKKKPTPKMNLDELKKRTKCHFCHKYGHWSKECSLKKNSNLNKQRNETHKKELAWCTVLNVGESKNESNFWFADSGASSHMTYHREWFSEYTEYSETCVVKIANGHCLEIKGIGTILIDARVNKQWEPRRLENVLFVPQIQQNLLSTAVLTEKGLQVLIQKQGCKVIDESQNVVAVGERYGKNLLKMDFRVRMEECANISTSVAATSLEYWHRRLGHISVDTIKKISEEGLVEGVNITNCDKFYCEDCQLGKMTRATHKATSKRPSSKGEYVHADLCGPMEEIGIGGMRYFLLIKDEATSFRFTYLIKSKEEVCDCLSSFISMVRTQNDIRVKHFRFDNGTEFLNRNVKKLMCTEGIQLEYITAYTPEQNGLIERDNRTIQESARTMLIASGLPKFLWPEAVRTATYLLNRTTNSNCIGTTPYEKWFGVKPYLGHVNIFGTECFVQIPKQTGRKKWDPKAKKVMLLGYEPTNKNFRLYDPLSKKVFISCDVRFKGDTPKMIPSPKVLNEDDDDSDESDAMGETVVAEQQIQESISAHKEPLQDAEQSTSQRSRQRYNLRPVVKLPERLIETGYSAVTIDPNTYEEAIQSTEGEQWKIAMDDEYNSLIKNHTWDLVNPPDDQQVIDNRWVFKVKLNTDASVDRYKARLVIRGFAQQYGVDYEETFSPVVKFTSVRAILSFAAMNKMQLRQFDIKTAFLYGDLKEHVFMKQPIGYDDNSGRVCKLIKSLYGLKQASRCWNQKFTVFIRDFNFKPCDSDPCVFVRRNKNIIVIVALYVDDGLVVSNSANEIDHVLSYLCKQFDVKVFDAKCFVGLEIEQFSDGSIRIHQTAYAKKILSRFNMLECNAVATPGDPNQNFSDFTQEEIEPNFPYRQAVGSLMYLAIGSRPDLSFAVGVVSRYLERPSPIHVKAVKRIFKYVKGTADMGILYESSNSFDFVGFSDADYAGDNETRRSTSGYVFHTGSGVISWASTRQQSVSTSSTESEYVAACQAIKELLWLKTFVDELTLKCDVKAKLFVDNQSAIRLVKNPVYHKRTKHIDVQYHFIREKFQEGKFDLEYVETNNQVADICTKSLTKNRHKYLCTLMNLCN
uniref:Integrase catalytic domain-containing protein n=1 Tax=Photinus pyralis TaxID=7054 RepID=A0A1Y1M571_PHOPY